MTRIKINDYRADVFRKEDDVVYKIYRNNTFVTEDRFSAHAVNPLTGIYCFLFKNGKESIIENLFKKAHKKAKYAIMVLSENEILTKNDCK